MSTPIAVDASVVVRYLTGDDKMQSAAAANLFRSAQTGKVKLLIPTSTIQETVYVLESVYNLDAATIAPKLISLLAISNMETPGARWVMEALQFYRTRNSNFENALLCAYAHCAGYDVATFDKGMLKKFPEINAFPPTDLSAGKVCGKAKEEQN